MKEDGSGGACSKHRAENVHKGENYLGKPRRKWENEISFEVKETGWKRVDWINRVQDMDEWRAVMSTVMNFRVQ